MKKRFLLLLVAGVLALGACSSDDDGGAITASAPASGSSSASGSGSGSGSAVADANTSDKGEDNPLVVQGAADYQAWVRTQTGAIRSQAKVFTDAVRAGDVEGAKAAFAPSRQAWEGIEPIASLVEEIDGAVDARVDDFESEEDPGWTGWHRLEHILWEKGAIDDTAKQLADKLDADLQTLETEVATLTVKPTVVAVGAAELIEEVSAGKITGEEDRYSHTDLWDFAANVAGSKQAFDFLRPALEEQDATLATDIDALFTELTAELETYREGEGFQSYDALTDTDKDAMKAILGELSEKLSTMAGTLGLS